MSIGVCDTQNQLTCTHWEVILCTELLKLLKRLKKEHPEAQILGHRDLPDVKKACPCFDAKSEYSQL